MNKHDRIYELIDELNYYNKLYDEGTPAITDKEYDDLYFELQTLEKETGLIFGNSPTQHINYQVMTQLNKVEHNHPMLSLNKTKSIQDILDFKGTQDVIAMLKMDGLTCSLCYTNGKLIKAETRGNGEIGEDITHNIITVKGVPTEIPFKNTLIVDGEVICTYKDFEPFSDKYANPRNFAAGSIRLLNNEECANRHLTFIVWDVIKGFEECKTLTEKLYKIDSLGFTFVPHFRWPENKNDEDTFNHISILLTNWAKDKDFQYPYDGLVFKYNNCDYYSSLGETGHHPKGGLAYKFYDEEYESKLRNIEWSMGKTGQITPVAIFDEIDDGESIVTRASIHNLNIMNQLLGHPYVGEDIKVIKANQIIPQIIWGDKKEDDMLWYLDPPTICPCCGGETYIKDDFLYCGNPDCEGKLINKLDHFAGKKGLDIKGLSKATLQKLINWNWVNNLHDLFTLESHYDEWIKKDGFGIKSVENILSAIQDGRECELWQFISAISIPLIGTTYAKEICKHKQNWDDIRKDINENFNFTQWDNFGYEINKSLHSFNYEEADELVENVLYLKNSLYNQIINNSKISGKVFVITGKLTTFKNRNEAKDKIENAGGKVVDSISSKTNYLVNNDINSTSSKNVKAKSLNIPIISEDELLVML